MLTLCDLTGLYHRKLRHKFISLLLLDCYISPLVFSKFPSSFRSALTGVERSFRVLELEQIGAGESHLRFAKTSIGCGSRIRRHFLLLGSHE